MLSLLLNGLLFAREQREKDFGPDLTLPGAGGLIFFDGTFTVTQEPVDVWAAYRRYSEWLDRTRKLPLADAITMLEDEKTALSAKITEGTDTEDDRLDYAAVNNLLSRTDYLAGYGDWLDNIQRNYVNYLNIDVFTYPLGVRSISQLALLPLCLIAAAVSVYVLPQKAGGRAGSAGAGGVQAQQHHGQAFAAPASFRHGASQDVVDSKGRDDCRFAGLCGAWPYIHGENHVSSSEDQAARQYTTQFVGEITDGTFARMDAEQAELDAVVAAAIRRRPTLARGL